MGEIDIDENNENNKKNYDVDKKINRIKKNYT